jgi:hypothetical protein
MLTDGLSDNRLLWLPIIFLIAVAAHAETAQYWFVAPDTLPLIETSRVRTIVDVVELFAQPLMAGTDFVDTALFYRPISSLSYALDYAAWQLSPSESHITNVLLHGTASVLVAVTIAKITRRLAVGYLSAVLFAVHPLTIGVIPAISRRQDVLLTIFVLSAFILFVRSHREKSSRLLGGALVAYTLALGSKETAVVLPGMVFIWLAIYRETDKNRSTLLRAVSGTAPFVLVTMAYVLVRLVVLDGIGGYRASAAPGPGISILFVPLKYLLWIFQPTNVVEDILVAVPRSALLILMFVGAAASLGIIQHSRVHDFGTLGVLALFVSSIAFEGLLGVHLLAPHIETLLPLGPTESDVAIGYIIRSLFIVGCTAGLLTTVLTHNRTFDSSTQDHFMFFGSWVLIVPGLLLVTGAGIGGPLQIGDQIQTGYLCLVPAMAGLSLLGLTAAEALVDTPYPDPFHFDANVALIVLTIVLVLPLVATSPIVVSYDEWENAGELNQQMLTELSDELEGTSPRAPVRLLDPPAIEGDEPPLATSVKQLQTYSFEAWFALQDPPQDREIELVGKRGISQQYGQVSLEATRKDGTFVIRSQSNTS